METVVAKIIYGVDEDGFVYGSKDRPDACPVCGNKIKDVYDLDYRLKRKSTLMVTYDGYTIVSQPFKDFCDANGYPGLSFTELTHYPGYYFFFAEKAFELDPNRIKFNGHHDCCGSADCISTPFKTKKEGFQIESNDFICRSDVRFGDKGKKFFLIFVGLETEKKMKQFRLKKIYYAKVLK